MCDFSLTVILPFESGFVSESLPTIIEIASEGIFSGVSIHMISEGLSAPKFKATCLTHNLFLLLLFRHFFLYLWVHQGTFAENIHVSCNTPSEYVVQYWSYL